jgi:hypothetical protein
MPRFWAQAMRSASEWQQHDRQHWSAELQPQLLAMQGNGSLAFGFCRLPKNTGTPAAVTEYASNTIAQMDRRRTGDRDANGVNQRMTHQEVTGPLLRV